MLNDFNQARYFLFNGPLAREASLKRFEYSRLIANANKMAAKYFFKNAIVTFGSNGFQATLAGLAEPSQLTDESKWSQFEAAGRILFVPKHEDPSYDIYQEFSEHPKFCLRKILTSIGVPHDNKYAIQLLWNRDGLPLLRMRCDHFQPNPTQLTEINQMQFIAMYIS